MFGFSTSHMAARLHENIKDGERRAAKLRAAENRAHELAMANLRDLERRVQRQSDLDQSNRLAAPKPVSGILNGARLSHELDYALYLTKAYLVGTLTADNVITLLVARGWYSIVLSPVRQVASYNGVRIELGNVQ